MYFVSLILDSLSLFSIFKNAISKYKNMQFNFQKLKINIRIKHILELNDKNCIFKILYK